MNYNTKYSNSSTNTVATLQSHYASMSNNSY